MTKRISVNNATHAEQAKIAIDTNAVEAALAGVHAVTPAHVDAEVHAGKAPMADADVAAKAVVDSAHADAADVAPAEMAMVAAGDAAPAVFAAGQDTTSNAAETATQSDETSDASYDDGGNNSDLYIGGGLLAAAVVGAVLVGSIGDDAEDNAGNPPPPPTPTPTPTPANTPPAFEDEAQALTTDEDTVLSGTATATDADGDTITYTNSDAAHGDVVVNDDGTFTYTPDADYNGDDSFTITASDGTDDATQTINITVDPVNDAPAFEDATQTATVEENSSTDTVVYTAEATDADGDTLTYSLSGDDASAFTIDADTGEIHFVSSPDFEAQESYSVTVVATDGDGATGSQALTVNVTDVDDTVNLDLDADDDSNLNTSAEFDGGAGATVFTEDADVSNNAHISNFGDDDVIVVSNAASGDYSFQADDQGITISFATETGQASEIHIDASAITNTSVDIFDEATAEQAVGFDFFQYA